MTAPTPLIYTWEGDAMRPLKRFAVLADKQFVVGQNYRLATVEERSSSSHAHYFACLQDAWENLPEDQTERFPTVDHLRKYCLIKAGFCNESTFVCGSAKEAGRFAAYLQSMGEYAIVTVRGKSIVRWTAKSQSYHAMGKADFQRSKDRVLDELAKLINVSAEKLSSNAGRAA